MQALRFTDRFKSLFDLALQLTYVAEADALMLLLEGEADWVRLKKTAGDVKLVVAADTMEKLRGAKENGVEVIDLPVTGIPVYERLTRTLLEAVADDILSSGSTVVAIYSGFEAGTLDM
jgi:hypothetical protein